jgi:hypothetical protein
VKDEGRPNLAGRQPGSGGSAWRRLLDVLYCERAAANVEIALREGDFDSGLAQFLFNCEIKIAPKTAWPITFFAAPHHQLEFECVLAEFFQENRGRRVLQCVRIFAASSEKRLANLVDVAAVSDPHRNSKTYARVAIGPVGDGRIYEFRVGHNHGDVVVRQDDSAARANLLDLTGHACDFDPIANGNWSLRQNDQAADKIAGNILQAKSHAHAHSPGENGQRAEMNAGVFENDENADDEHDIADDLGNGVLQRAIKPAIDEETIEQETLGPRRGPKDGDQQPDKKKNLEQTDRDTWQRRIPGKRNSGRVDCIDRKKDQRGQAQDRGNDCDEIIVDLKPGEKTPHHVALQRPGDEEPDAEKSDKSNEAKKRNVIARHIEQWPLQKRQIHRFLVWAGCVRLQPAKQKTRTKPCSSVADAL